MSQLIPFERKEMKDSMTGYEIYLADFWSKHRKIGFKLTTDWADYDTACKTKRERLGRAKTVDHYSMTGDAYLLPDGKVIEIVQSCSDYYAPQVRTFESLQDWNDWISPMPPAIYLRG